MITKEANPAQVRERFPLSGGLNLRSSGPFGSVWLGLALGLLVGTSAWADPPPNKAPTSRPAAKRTPAKGTQKPAPKRTKPAAKGTKAPQKRPKSMPMPFPRLDWPPPPAARRATKGPQKGQKKGSPKGQKKGTAPTKRGTQAKQRRRRRRRRNIAPVVVPIPKLDSKLVQDLKRLKQVIARFKERSWSQQGLLLSRLAKAKGKTTQALRESLKHPHIRVRLLAAQALAKRNDSSALPLLLKEARRFFDQPTPLLFGALLAYGTRVVPPVIQAAKADLTKAQVLIKALGYLRAKAAAPLLTQLLTHQHQTIREIAREALMRLGTPLLTQGIQKALHTKPDASIRANLIRMLAYKPSHLGASLLLQSLQDPDSSLRFLARISFEDLANNAHKGRPKQIEKPPTDRRIKSWKRWWQRNQKALAAWYKDSQTPALSTLFPKTGQPKVDHKKVLFLYRTVHPVFGYGRMPLLIHHASWKKPKSPIKGKVWYLPLPDKEFLTLARQVERSGFFQWSPNMGNVRDLSVHYGTRTHKVSNGMLRYVPFEVLERRFVKLAKRAKLGLKFKDFYLRRDEADISAEGKIGQWAYRKMDFLKQRPWSPLKGWTPKADLEGAWHALRDICRLMPSRTRIISLDLSKYGIRISTLLFGSRSQSRLTKEAMERSRRLSGFKLVGLGVQYMSSDKIEQMIFDLQRQSLPQSSRSSAKTTKRGHATQMLKAVWQPKSSQLLDLRYQRAPSGKLFRWYVRFKATSTKSLLQTLARLASHSQGDKLLTLRINQSGEADRDRFQLIVQMQWEMLSPLPTPTKLPENLNHTLRSTYELFSPVYR